MNTESEIWLQERNRANEFDTARHTAEYPSYKPWWRRAWPLLAIAVVIILITIIVVPVEVEKKKNQYPDYSKLTYSLADTCTSISSLTRHWRSLATLSWR